MRPCQGGLLWGVYEEAPRFFDMQSLGTTFDIKNMPLDIEVFVRLPPKSGATADPANGQGTGISRWHPDNDRGRSSHSRPRPGVEGFYFASGCNVAGLSISPTVGEALAAWIVDGKPPMDLAPMSVARFPQKSPSTYGTRTVVARRSSTARSSALSLILLAFRLATIAPELLIPSRRRVARSSETGH